MDFHQIRLRCPNQHQAKNLVERIEASLHGAFGSVSYVRSLDDKWDITLILNEQSAAKEKVAEYIQHISLLDRDAEILGSEEVPDRDWVTHSLQDLSPVISGRFVVHGSHAQPFNNFGRIGVCIDAGLAFGTGHHETTNACLKLLTDVLKRRQPKKVLDLGCGSGVLAIAFTNKSPRTAIASDIDPIAVKVAQENGVANQSGNRIRYVVADGPAHPMIFSAAPFDLIFANILAKPLKRLALGIRAAAAARSSLILSGLLLEQEPAVLSAYRMTGFRLEKRLVNGAWSTLLLSRGRS